MENITLTIHHGDKWLDEAKEFNEKLDHISHSRPSSQMEIIRMIGVPVKFLLLRDGVQTEHPIPAGTDEFKALNDAVKSLGLNHDLVASLRAMEIYHHVESTTKVFAFPHAELLADWQIMDYAIKQPIDRSLVFLYNETPAPMESDRYIRECITLNYAS